MATFKDGVYDVVNEDQGIKTCFEKPKRTKKKKKKKDSKRCSSMIFFCGQLFIDQTMFFAI